MTQSARLYAEAGVVNHRDCGGAKSFSGWDDLNKLQLLVAGATQSSYK